MRARRLQGEEERNAKQGRADEDRQVLASVLCACVFVCVRVVQRSHQRTSSDGAAGKVQSKPDWLLGPHPQVPMEVDAGSLAGGGGGGGATVSARRYLPTLPSSQAPHRKLVLNWRTRAGFVGTGTPSLYRRQLEVGRTPSR